MVIYYVVITYTYMDISDGKYMVAISDGMGKGKKLMKNHI